MSSSYSSKLVLGLILLAALLLGCTVSGQNLRPTDAETAAAAMQSLETAEAETETAVLAAAGTAQAQQGAAATAVVLTTTAEAEAAMAQQQIEENGTATAVAETTETALQAALEATNEANTLEEKRISLEAVATTRALANEGRDLIRSAKLNTPVFGPGEGQLTHYVNQSVVTNFVNANIRDFVVEAVFITDTSDKIGYGFEFRYGTSMAWKLIITEGGEWKLARQVGDYGIMIMSGELSALPMGEQNKITLYANDSQGFFFINDQYIADLPLSTWRGTGDVSVVAEYSVDNGKAGETTQYQDFTIWPLEEIVAEPLSTKSAPTVPIPTKSAPVTAPAPPPAFDASSVILNLDNMRLTIEQMGGLLDRLYHEGTADCGEFYWYYETLQFRPPMAGLPADWQGIINDYNFAAENAMTSANNVKIICDEGGGSIDELGYGIARQGIGVSLDRINQALQAANQLAGR